MGLRTLDAENSGLIQSPLLDNPGSTNLMVVDWFGLSESNVPAGPGRQDESAPTSAPIPIAALAEEPRNLWSAAVAFARRARSACSQRAGHRSRG